MHKSFSKHLVSLQNFDNLQKAIDFLLCISYSTVVSPYLFIDICDIFFHTQNTNYFTSLRTFTSGIFIN